MFVSQYCSVPRSTSSEPWSDYSHVVQCRNTSLAILIPVNCLWPGFFFLFTFSRNWVHLLVNLHFPIPNIDILFSSFLRFFFPFPSDCFFNLLHSLLPFYQFFLLIKYSSLITKMCLDTLFIINNYRYELYYECSIGILSPVRLVIRSVTNSLYMSLRLPFVIWTGIPSHQITSLTTSSDGKILVTGTSTGSCCKWIRETDDSVEHFLPQMLFTPSTSSPTLSLVIITIEETSFLVSRLYIFVYLSFQTLYLISFIIIWI